MIYQIRFKTKKKKKKKKKVYTSTTKGFSLTVEWKTFYLYHFGLQRLICSKFLSYQGLTVSV